jgi:hypothetical protein
VTLPFPAFYYPTFGDGEEPNRANAVTPSPSARLPSLAGIQPHTVTITYTPNSGGLVSVYLDGGTQPVTQAAINLSAGGLLPISTAWIGLTSTNGAGAYNATVQILSWTFGPAHQPQLMVAASGLLGAADPTTGVIAPAVVPITATVEVSGDVRFPCSPNATQCDGMGGRKTIPRVPGARARRLCESVHEMELPGFSWPRSQEWS